MKTALTNNDKNKAELPFSFEIVFKVVVEKQYLKILWTGTIEEDLLRKTYNELGKHIIWLI
jgi:hypothetical protein